MAEQWVPAARHLVARTGPRPLGHSAGPPRSPCAMVPTTADQRRGVVSLNGSRLLRSRAPRGGCSRPMAKLMFLKSLTPRVLAFGARGPGARVRRPSARHGFPTIDPGQALYERPACRRPRARSPHPRMMAAWDLAPAGEPADGYRTSAVVLVARRGRPRRNRPGQGPPAWAERLPLAEVVVLPRARAPSRTRRIPRRSAASADRPGRQNGTPGLTRGATDQNPPAAPALSNSFDQTQTLQLLHVRLCCTLAEAPNSRE